MSMQLPHELQHFPHAAIIVVSNHIIGRIFLVGGDALEELDGCALPRERKQDAEGAGIISGTSRVVGPNSKPNDKPRLKRFIKELANLTNKYVRDHNVVHVHLVMPADIEHRLYERLDSEMKKKLGRRVLHDLIQEHPLEIVRRILEVA